MKRIVIILIVISLFISCQNDKRNNKEAITFGIALSLTGDGADYGQKSLKGINAAKAVILKNFGVNINFKIEDTGSDPKKAVSAINKLILQDKMDFIVGDIISGTTLAMAPVAEKNKKMLFAPGASNPSMRDAGDYIFRNWTSDNFDGKVIANYCMSNNLDKIGLIYQQTDYTVGLIQAFKEEFLKLGGEIILEESFSTGNNNLTPIISKFKENKINNVFISAYSMGTGYILKQSYELNYKPNWFSSLTVEMPDCGEIAGKARDGVIFSTPAFSLNDTSIIVQQFVNEFKDLYNELPETTAGHAFDAIYLLSKLLIESKSKDMEIIKKAIYNTKNFKGVTGTMTFDDHGDVLKNIFIKKMEADSSILIKNYEIN